MANKTSGYHAGSVMGDGTDDRMGDGTGDGMGDGGRDGRRYEHGHGQTGNKDQSNHKSNHVHLARVLK